ncbi:MAG TPA: hypothetical protein VLK85_09995 [Ramlibacter sp.]|nr:hypothetical protein [Ramlibacter sp.]
MPHKVAIVGVGLSEIVRHSEKSLGALALDACLAAIDDAGLKVGDIDGICNYPSPSRLGAGDTDGVDIVGVKYIAQALRLDNLSWFNSMTTGTITASVVEAAAAIASGICTTALVWRGMHNPRGKFGASGSIQASGDAQFTAPYGLANNVMSFAFAYSQYLAKYGATRRHLGAYVVNCRRNANLNPAAPHFGKPITLQDYLDARMIAAPLSLLDCDMPVDGCGAVVLTTAERARHLRHAPVHIRGAASGGFKYRHSPIMDLESCEEGGAGVARALWKNAGLAPRDIDFVNLYDGFSYFVYTWLEAFGFCRRGEAFQFIQDGRIALEGALPLNPSGGAMGMGRLHGTPQLVEAVLQLQGRAADRQLKRANVTLVNSGGPITGNGALVLARDA